MHLCGVKWPPISNLKRESITELGVCRLRERVLLRDLILAWLPIFAPRLILNLPCDCSLKEHAEGHKFMNVLEQLSDPR